MAMRHTIEVLKLRIHNLKQKDAVANKNIINKLERKIRKMEKKYE